MVNLGRDSMLLLTSQGSRQKILLGAASLSMLAMAASMSHFKAEGQHVTA